MAQPGALKAIRQAEGRERQAFNADERTKKREDTPVVVGGVSFRRRRKDWLTSRAMRQMMRSQESAIARSGRLRARVSELEVKQIEAAAEGDTETETGLEGQITELIRASDVATEEAELVSYRLLALLLIPPSGERTAAERTAAEGEPEPEPLVGWGPLEEEEADLVEHAIAFLQPALDVEDAADLARELTGSDEQEPDPQTTPSSGNGSS